MNLAFPAALVLCVLLASGPASAGPGAHGPNGEHLDGPSPVLSAGASVPRVEAKSETFELVARVEGNGLSILIDRYDSNEPVLDAGVEVESGPLKQKGAFRREQGDYWIADPAFMKALASPGSHSLVFTVNAGNDVDLLEGTLPGADAAPSAAMQALARYGAVGAWIGGGVLFAGAVGVFIRRRRTNGAAPFMGGAR